MKKIILPIVLLALVGFGAIRPGLTDEEREMAVNELKKTRDHLMKTVDGLSDEQLNFKPTPESWSIAECVEHIAVAENNIGGMLQEALQTPADSSKRDSVKLADADIMALITRRAQKASAPESFEPSGKFGSFEETLAEFMAKREKHIAYLNSTEDDLRNHYGQLPFGTIDGLQILLFMSGHTERHLKQIEEVAQHEGFPKNMAVPEPK